MNVLIFGAGSTGRGHLAALLHENGCRDLVFVDKDSRLVQTLAEADSYQVRLLGARERTLDIGGYDIIDRRDEAKVIAAFLAADLVLTAVIAENLDDVARVMAKAVAARRQAGNRQPLNVIACENLNNASSRLKMSVYGRLAAEDTAYAEAVIGFPDAMISRVVPLAKENPLRLIAEDYNEWVVRGSAFKGANPDMLFMSLTDNLEARLERKIWIHNGGHATVAYAGLLRGHTYIHEAVADQAVAAFAGKVLDEIGDTVIHKHKFPQPEIREYQRDLARRGAMAEMKDDILRVVRDPIRKLGVADRLLAPAIYAEAHGLENESILRSVGNVLKYECESDAEAVTMHRTIAARGVKFFLEETIGLQPYPGIVRKIINLAGQKED